VVAVWPRGNNVAHTNSHSMLNLVSSAIGDHSHVYCSGISVTSHPGQLSLIPSAEWQISASQGAVAVFVGWEDNHRSGITLAICHRLWHPANTPVWGTASFIISSENHKPDWGNCRYHDSLQCCPLVSHFRVYALLETRHTVHCWQIWCHPQNRKYITYCTAV